MPEPKEPLREHPSAYVVQDRSNQQEMTRLEIQDAMITAGMGGVLPEQADPTTLRSVLDVGCGTGGWLRETAKAYPMIEKLVGVDISASMVVYARTQAQAEHLDDRVQFRTMDALRILEFPPASFDMVNQRAGVSWLRTVEWTKILLEYQRICRPGGIIRITELDACAESNSPALTALWKISLETVYNSGRLFTPSSDGVTAQLARLLTLHGLQDIQSRSHTLHYLAGTENTRFFFEDMRHAFRLFVPFFQKWTRLPHDYEDIYQQALKDMQAPDFRATWNLTTTWGTKPMDAQPLLRRGLT